MQPAAVLPQDTLEIASSFVDRSLHVDRNYTDLSDELQIPKHSECDLSSLVEKPRLVASWCGENGWPEHNVPIRTFCPKIGHRNWGCVLWV